MFRLAHTLAAVAVTFGALTGCTKDAEKTGEPVDGQAPAQAEAAAKVQAPAKPAAPMPEDSCRVLEKVPNEPPVNLPGKNVVLTHLMKPCVTRDGHRGYAKDTPWLAMGFPCTGGSGRIDIKGNYYNPKMVSFILGIDCAMSPSAKDVVDKIVKEALALPAEAKLMSFTPFNVQYWEVPSISESDTGYAIELRSAPATESLWKHFKDKAPVRVRLYGRDSAWVQGDNFYFVEADLKQTGHAAFQLEVMQVKSLSKDEVGQVKGRCEALRPKRNCAEVF